MFIHEAISAAKETGIGTYGVLIIRRKSWPGYRRGSMGKFTEIYERILLTNGPGKCFVIGSVPGDSREWAPSMDDLAADDWEPWDAKGWGYDSKETEIRWGDV